MRFLDTNIIIRYLTRDDEKKANACFELFQRVKGGEEKVTTCEAIITEVVYVLSSSVTYNLSPKEIRDKLIPILTLRGLRLRNKRMYVHALDIYATHGFLDFEDAISTAYMEKWRIHELYSYDSDFDKVDIIDRIEPPLPR